MIHPFHHLHIRKRIHTKKEKYPHPNKAIKWLDRVIIIAGVLAVVATVPQALEIWVNQSAEGVSTISWAYYTFHGVLFTIYGAVHKAAPIVFNYSLATIFYGLVTVGSIVY